MTLHTHARHANKGQGGLSLIELLVGLALGLLVIAVAMGALMASRSVTGTVSDASVLQQQASQVFRILGRQIRQAGTLRLNLAVHKAPGEAIDAADAVAFEARTQDFNPAQDTVRGLDNPANGQFKLVTGYSNYTLPLHLQDEGLSLQRNCLGQVNSDTLIQSRFVLDTRNNSLRCAGGDTAQPFAENVANFQVRYLLQEANGIARLRYVNAADVQDNWPRVFGVEVCLVLFGTEAVDMPAGSTYTDCAGSDGKAATIDMTALPTPRTGRLHMVFRSVYQLRSQGLAG
ncbi:MAG: PilW family protein [Delftia acidovorans]|jgi:type IV pilus assembly protein PilW|nr:PilW family protein [Delftia acidovorans]MDR3017576.1 PilW family protein [Delftia acidovorans]